MRILISISILILVSCSKEKAGDLGPYYSQFIGKWKSINASEKVEIKVEKDGIISISHEIDRRKKIVVNNWRPDTLSQDVTWVGYRYFSKDNSSVSLLLSPTGDSLRSRSVSLNIVDQELNTESNYQIFQRIE